jgi:hypothetical protein
LLLSKSQERSSREEKYMTSSTGYPPKHPLSNSKARLNAWQTQRPKPSPPSGLAPSPPSEQDEFKQDLLKGIFEALKSKQEVVLKFNRIDSPSLCAFVCRFEKIHDDKIKVILGAENTASITINSGAKNDTVNELVNALADTKFMAQEGVASSELSPTISLDPDALSSEPVRTPTQCTESDLDKKPPMKQLLVFDKSDFEFEVLSKLEKVNSEPNNVVLKFHNTSGRSLRDFFDRLEAARKVENQRFFKEDFIDAAKSKRIYEILKEQGVIDESDKITSRIVIDQDKVNTWLEGETNAIKEHVLGILQQARFYKQNIELFYPKKNHSALINIRKKEEEVVKKENVKDFLDKLFDYKFSAPEQDGSISACYIQEEGVNVGELGGYWISSRGYYKLSVDLGDSGFEQAQSEQSQSEQWWSENRNDEKKQALKQFIDNVITQKQNNGTVRLMFDNIYFEDLVNFFGPTHNAQTKGINFQYPKKSGKPAVITIGSEAKKEDVESLISIMYYGYKFRSDNKCDLSARPVCKIQGTDRALILKKSSNSYKKR